MTSTKFCRENITYKCYFIDFLQRSSDGDRGQCRKIERIKSAENNTHNITLHTSLNTVVRQHHCQTRLRPRTRFRHVAQQFICTYSILTYAYLPTMLNKGWDTRRVLSTRRRRQTGSQTIGAPDHHILRVISSGTPNSPSVSSASPHHRIHPKHMQTKGLYLGGGSGGGDGV